MVMRTGHGWPVLGERPVCGAQRSLDKQLNWRKRNRYGGMEIGAVSGFFTLIRQQYAWVRGRYPDDVCHEGTPEDGVLRAAMLHK